ncbi:MAG: N-acetyltransferase [Longimicrobiales bacterium]
MTSQPASRQRDVPAATARAGITIRPVTSRDDLARFIRFPWRIYANDPVWVPPLIADVKLVLDPERHPFHQHAEVQLFLAWRDGEVAGRIAAILNHTHNQFHDETTNFFGLFESLNEQAVADALLHTVEVWAHDRGMTTLRGPMNLSTNDELVGPGVLVDGFDTPPVLMMGHTPSWYAALLEGAGYAKAMDLLAYWIPAVVQDRHVRFAARVQKRMNVRFQSLDMKRFEEDVALVQGIYNSAWEKNWAFVPMSDAEIRHLAKQLKPVIKPDFCVLAFVDDEPVGFGLMLPDYNRILRRLNGRLFPFGFIKLLWLRRNIDSVRILTLGLKPAWRHRGLDALLIHQLIVNGLEQGIRYGECSWILEDNVGMRRGIENAGGRLYKTYRVFEKSLDPETSARGSR